MFNKLTIKDFIQQARQIHKSQYDYSLVKHLNYWTNVNIFCHKHQIIFSQTPYTHIVKKNGCPKCKLIMSRL